MKSRSRAALVAVPFLLIFPSCATSRLGQFHAFAQAGVSYVTATQTVIQDAGNAAVNTDSALLIKSRQDLTPAQRRERLASSNALLKQRLQVLQLISTHGKLLQDYFEALASLSDPNAANSVGTAAQKVYDSLALMSPTLKNAKMGSTSVSSFIPSITAPVVTTFKVHALNEELIARSKSIMEELALQEGAFTAVESELKVDTQMQQNFSETDNINQFTASAALPADWATQRLAILSESPAVASAAAASQAAAGLRKYFAALVENRIDSAGFSILIGKISNVASIGQTIGSGMKN